MGRKVRRVPADWQHPKNDKGGFIPLFGQSYAKAAADWDEGARQWDMGFRDGYSAGWIAKEADITGTYAEWAGERPLEEDFMPDWPDEQRTHIQMYEDTSEGTPISPVMQTPEELAHWLADNGASAFGGMTATYDQWLATINRGFACSAVITGGHLESGVAGMSKSDD